MPSPSHDLACGHKLYSMLPYGRWSSPAISPVEKVIVATCCNFTAQNSSASVPTVVRPSGLSSQQCRFEEHINKTHWQDMKKGCKRSRPLHRQPTRGSLPSKSRTTKCNKIRPSFKDLCCLDEVQVTSSQTDTPSLGMEGMCMCSQ